jgi:hypothetical protein
MRLVQDEHKKIDTRIARRTEVRTSRISFPHGIPSQHPMQQRLPSASVLPYHDIVTLHSARLKVNDERFDPPPLDNGPAGRLAAAGGPAAAPTAPPVGAVHALRARADLARAPGQLPAELQQGAADLVANGGVVLLVVGARGHGGRGRGGDGRRGGARVVPVVVVVVRGVVAVVVVGHGRGDVRAVRGAAGREESHGE